MPLHDVIDYCIQAAVGLGVGLALLFIGRRVNEVHVLVNSKMTNALAEIELLNKALDAANSIVGKHDK